MHLSVRQTPRDTYGAWLNKTKTSDVHVYVNNQWVIIGQNKDYRDQVNFSDMALMLTDSRAQLQYVDHNGKPAYADVDPKLVYGVLLGALQAIKESVEP